jgi:hypothetical protein
MGIAGDVTKCPQAQLDNSWQRGYHAASADRDTPRIGFALWDVEVECHILGFI